MNKNEETKYDECIWRVKCKSNVRVMSLAVKMN